MQRPMRCERGQVVATPALQPHFACLVRAAGIAVALSEAVVAVTPYHSGRFRNIGACGSGNRSHQGKGSYELHCSFARVASRHLWSGPVGIRAPRGAHRARLRCGDHVDGNECAEHLHEDFGCTLDCCDADPLTRAQASMADQTKGGQNVSPPSRFTGKDGRREGDEHDAKCC